MLNESFAGIGLAPTPWHSAAASSAPARHAIRGLASAATGAGQ
jgi:hypothetical protein